MRGGVHLVALLLIAACGPPPPDVHVAAATNVKPALDRIASDFEGSHALSVRISYGSTGKLAAQILSGAPFDVFLAADQARPAQLVAAGAVRAESVRPYAVGALLLWCPGREPTSETSVASILKDASIEHVAIANPELAPYGRAAKEAISSLGLERSFRSKLVYGENIGQAYALVATGNAQCGFIARSQQGETMAPVWPIDDAGHAPIVQDAVLVSSDASGPAALFFDYISSEAAQAVLDEHGYRAP